MKWTGLTGGIATGKSTAKKLIEGLGASVIDADQISHKLTEVGEPGYNRIVSHFGEEILADDLSIDRKKLAQLIFSNAGLKSELESILHPLIQLEVQKQKKLYQEKGVALCIYDVPLLFEKNLTKDFDTTILVWCDAKTQMDRLLNREKLTLDEAQLRIKNQLCMADKIRMADHCLDNSGSLRELEIQIKKLMKTIGEA